MLKEIISKLDPETVEQAGLVLHGLQLQPYDDCVVISVLPSSSPFEPGSKRLDPTAMRELARVLTVTANAIEGVHVDA